MGSRLLPYGAPNDHSAVITVIVDDLAFLAVDAVVRPADESLAPLTSEGSRLDRLAGEGFAAQRRVTSPLQAGAAVVTGGGDLAAPYVLHAVIRDPQTPVDRATVRRALCPPGSARVTGDYDAWPPPWSVPDRAG